VRWPLLRISSRLATALYTMLLANRAAGHEEIVTTALCEHALRAGGGGTTTGGRHCSVADHGLEVRSTQRYDQRVEWNGMEWNGMEWNGMEWINGMHSCTNA
jgi:hypothetical protein